MAWKKVVTGPFLAMLYSNTVFFFFFFFLIQQLCESEVVLNRCCSFVQCKNDITLILRNAFTLVCWVTEFYRMYPVKHPYN